MPFHRRTRAALVLAICAIGSSGQAGEISNFGYPFGFSVDKMDSQADPRQDFARYTAGKWIDAATIPPDKLRVSSLDQMANLVDAQVKTLLDDSAKAALTAPKGSPLQQVGSLYASGMNERLLTELGVSPLQEKFARIDAIRSPKDLAQTIAYLGLVTNEAYVLASGVMPDIADRTRYSILVGDGMLGLDNLEHYLKPEYVGIREAYLKWITDALVIAGGSPPAAKATADMVLALETRVAKVRQTPVEQTDPDKRFARMSYAEVKALTPSFDWDAYFAELGLKAPQEVIAIEVSAMRERAAAIAALSQDDQQAYLRWELLRLTADYLTPAFAERRLALSHAIFGKTLRLPPRSEQVARVIARKLGHPLAELYVQRYFTPESKRAVEEMIGLIRTQFRERLENNQWLTPATRQHALYKLDKIKISIGYPEQWIDYSPVDLRAGDYLGDILRISEFLSRRELARIGKPVTEDAFNDPRSTLPTVVNAAYDETRNSIEIPAAFLQPPMYDPKVDSAINFCSIGAVIGHELTHGFDSQGRRYDADGAVRDWWVPADEKKFKAQTAKLVRQANAYQVLPGLRINGELAVGENLADVGGISFAYGALEKFLKQHPEENKKIDGFTPEQRCFIAWGQAWASSKTREGVTRQLAATDPHPPNKYRAFAAAQHTAGFYKAFGIRPGDPMWLSPKDRVAIW